MATMIVRYRDDDGVGWGKLSGPAPRSRSDMLSVVPFAVGDINTAGLIAAYDATKLTEGPSVPVHAFDLLSPVTEDAKLLCQGLNYSTHAAEAGLTHRRQNLLFMKASSSLSGPYSDVIRPSDVELLDYEVEIGIILRAPICAGTKVTVGTIGKYVAGVVLCNDISARDVMFGATFMQWFQGKSYRTFCPTGPLLYLLEPSEVAETLENLEMSLWLNGELRQRARSSQLLHGPAETLTLVATIMDLGPGDMVLTGTPGGVIAQGSPQLIEVLRSNILEDEKRRKEMRELLSTEARFLRSGDAISTTLRDLRLDQYLGSQEYNIRDQI